jgi:uncharacterized protein YjbI with pentapeptide repeats
MNARSIALAGAVAAALLSWTPPSRADAPVRSPIAAAEMIQLIHDEREIAHRTIPAADFKEALQKAASGIVSITDSEIVGPLDMRSQSLRLRCTFRDVTFAERADFEGSSFSGQTTFSGKTRFPKGAIFSRSNFLGEVSFEGAVAFDDWFEASQAAFNKQARFDGVAFNRKASFSGTSFRDAASFAHSRFNFGSTQLPESGAFEDTQFFGRADFSDTKFAGGVGFERAIFQKDAAFFEAGFERARFKDTFFAGKALFSGSTLTDTAIFQHTTFTGEAYLDRINAHAEARAGDLVFTEAIMNGRLHFAGSRLHGISFAQDHDVRLLQPSFPAVFEKSVDLSALDCDAADFTGAVFRDYADFKGASFRRFASFEGVSFGGDVNFFETEFPPAPPAPLAVGGDRLGLDLDGVRFEKRVDLDVDQLLDGGSWLRPARPKLTTTDTATWATLEQAFKAAGDLHGRNEASYQRRLLAPSSDRVDREGRLANQISRIFWGYGLRPWRLAAWILVLQALFAAIYWTQTGSLAEGRDPREAQAYRVRFAIAFARRTALSWGYGYENARTPAFKAIALGHSIGTKLLLLVLLRAMANQSPWLNDLLGRILPF